MSLKTRRLSARKGTRCRGTVLIPRANSLLIISAQPTRKGTIAGHTSSNNTSWYKRTTARVFVARRPVALKEFFATKSPKRRSQKTKALQNHQLTCYLILYVETVFMCLPNSHIASVKGRKRALSQFKETVSHWSPF